MLVWMLCKKISHRDQFSFYVNDLAYLRILGYKINFIAFPLHNLLVHKVNRKIKKHRTNFVESKEKQQQ